MPKTKEKAAGVGVAPPSVKETKTKKRKKKRASSSSSPEKLSETMGLNRNRRRKKAPIPNQTKGKGPPPGESVLLRRSPRRQVSFDPGCDNINVIKNRKRLKSPKPSSGSDEGASASSTRPLGIRSPMPVSANFTPLGGSTETETETIDRNQEASDKSPAKQWQPLPESANLTPLGSGSGVSCKLSNEDEEPPNPNLESAAAAKDFVFRPSNPNFTPLGSSPVPRVNFKIPKRQNPAKNSAIDFNLESFGQTLKAEISEAFRDIKDKLLRNNGMKGPDLDSNKSSSSSMPSSFNRSSALINNEKSKTEDIQQKEHLQQQITSTSRQQLKARRRLTSNSSEQRNNSEEYHGGSQPPKNSVLPQFPTKLIEELPDYEDAIDEEETEDDMISENPIPEIMKMVQDNASPPRDQEDVVSMDVDLEVKKEKLVVVVPDTNIWIGNLDLIDKLLKQEFPTPLQLVIPWMVLQELDVGIHKKEKGNGSWNSNFRRPIKFIHSLLANNHPRVKGQRSYEAAISKLEFTEMVADDSILNCAVKNSEKDNCTVIFLSNDYNLLNKAIVSGLIAVDSTAVWKKVHEVMTDGNANILPSSGFSSSRGTLTLAPTDTSSSYFPAKANVPVKRKFSISSTSSSSMNMEESRFEDVEMMDTTTSPMLSVPQTKVRSFGQPFSSTKSVLSFSNLENALVKAFSHIIKKKMIEDYGEKQWEYPLKFKPPFTLLTAVKCMLAHWITNFSYVFSRYGQKYLESIKASVERHGTVTAHKIVQDKIIDDGISLLNLLVKQYERDPEVLECKHILLKSVTGQ